MDSNAPRQAEAGDAATATTRTPWWASALDRWTWHDEASDRRRVDLTLERGLLVFALAIFASGLAAAVAASFGIFRVLAPVILVAWVGLLAAVVWLAATRRLRVRGDWYDAGALVLAALVGLSAGALHHEYVLGTFDSGFYFEDAWLISQTGGRTIDGPFDALTPGFADTDGGGRYEPFWSIGLPALAAIFGYAFGLTGIFWVNAPLLFLASLALYRVARGFSAPVGGLLAIGFYGASHVTVWLGRWLTTEALLTAILWTAVLLALPLLRRWDPWRAGGLALALLYAAVVRPEGPILLPWFALVIAVWQRRRIARLVRTWDDRLRSLNHRSALRGGAIALGVAAVATGWVLVRLVARGFFENARLAVGYLLQGRPIPDDFLVPMTGPSPNWGDYALRYEWDSFTEYYLHLFLAVAILGLVLKIVKPRRAGQLALLLVPYLFVVLMPPVTTFHPWYMRRLWVAVIPLVFVLAAVALDPHRLGYRWPVRPTKSRRDYPRPSTIAVGAIIILILLLFNVGPAQSIYGEREDDGARATSTYIVDALPDDAILVADLEATPHVGPLRFLHERDVVFWFQRQPDSLLASVAAIDTGRPVYVMTATAAQMPLEPVPGSEDPRQPFEIPFVLLERQNLREYIADPPLENGYGPLADYLEGSVPADDMLQIGFSFTLVEMASSNTIEKGVEFDRATWNATAHGMVGGAGGGLLRVDASLFAHDTRQLALYVVYPQTWTGQEQLAVRSANGSFEALAAAVWSDGSGELRLARVPIPLDVEPAEIRVPPDVPVRAAMMGLAAYSTQYANGTYPVAWA